jgi:hypothetical protein
MSKLKDAVHEFAAGPMDYLSVARRRATGEDSRVIEVRILYWIPLLAPANSHGRPPLGSSPSWRFLTHHTIVICIG